MSDLNIITCADDFARRSFFVDVRDTDFGREDHCRRIEVHRDVAKHIYEQQQEIKRLRARCLVAEDEVKDKEKTRANAWEAHRKVCEQRDEAKAEIERLRAVLRRRSNDRMLDLDSRHIAREALKDD